MHKEADERYWACDNIIPWLVCNKFLQDRQCMYDIMLWYVRVTSVAVKKQYVLNIMHVGVRILALVIGHANHMRHIIVPAVACQAVPYFSTFIS
jgi:hypothetical protein